jgi:hypothetical protein
MLGTPGSSVAIVPTPFGKEKASGKELRVAQLLSLSNEQMKTLQEIFMALGSDSLQDMDLSKLNMDLECKILILFNLD